MRALPRDPVLDLELAEELAHRPLLDMGITDRSTLWIATLIARACVAINVRRQQGLPCADERRVLHPLRVEMERRLLVHHIATRPRSPQRPWWEHKLSVIGDPMPIQVPVGWMEVDDGG